MVADLSERRVQLYCHFLLLLHVCFFVLFVVFYAFFDREVHLKLSANVMTIEKHAPYGWAGLKKSEGIQGKQPFLDCMLPTKVAVPIPHTSWTEDGV